MPRAIFTDPSYNQSFLQNGYLVLDLLSKEDIAAMKAVFASVEAQHQYDYVASVVLHDLAMRESIHYGLEPIFKKSILPVLDAYKFVLGSFVSKKAASENGKFPLHQDPTFVEEEEYAALSIWCPLVDVDRHNGCLGILPGSHLLNNTFRTASMLPYPELVDVIESGYMEYIPMQAGQVMFMNTRMVHGSPPNLSNNTRPVAAGVAIPAEQPLICCYVDETESTGMTQVFNVANDFYLRHIMRSRPTEGQAYKTVKRQIEPLTKEKIEGLANMHY